MIKIGSEVRISKRNTDGTGISETSKTNPEHSPREYPVQKKTIHTSVRMNTGSDTKARTRDCLITGSIAHSNRYRNWKYASDNVQGLVFAIASILYSKINYFSSKNKEKLTFCKL